MVQVRVRAVANVMGLRRGDEGDVETGSPHIDAMINAGYLQVLEYLPDPEPVVEAFPTVAAVAAQFATDARFQDTKLVDPDFDKKNWVAPPPAEPNLAGWVDPPPTVAEVEATMGEEVKPRGKPNSSKSRSRPSRSRSAAARRSTGDTGDGPDAQPSVDHGTGGHGEPASPAPDEQADGEA